MSATPEAVITAASTATARRQRATARAWASARRDRDRAADGRAGRDHRQRALPHIQTRWVSPTGTWSGSSTRTHSPSAACCSSVAGRRPAGPSPDLHRRHRAVLASLAARRVRHRPGLDARRGPSRASASVAAPTALSLIAVTFPEGPPRNRAMSVYAAMSVAGAAVGLIVGGMLTTYANWRWVLFVNVPIGILVAFAAPRVLASPSGSVTAGGSTCPARSQVPSAWSPWSTA